MTTVKEKVDNIGFGGFTASNEDVQNAMEDQTIKEILREIKSYENEDVCIVVLSQKENKALVNYINNLQVLEKESEMYENELFRKAQDYKSRCKKAIEYINKRKVITQGHFNGNNWEYQYFELRCEPNDLLNILQGDYNE